jgi:hypothetical protein
MEKCYRQGHNRSKKHYCRQRPNDTMKKCCSQGPNGTMKKCCRQGPNSYNHVPPPGSGNCLKSTLVGRIYIIDPGGGVSI